MTFDWVVLRGEDSFVKYVLNCFWVIHVSAAVGEVKETAACMYIHYCGLGMEGEIMFQLSKWLPEQSTYSSGAAGLHCPGPAGLWQFAETARQEFCVTKSSQDMNSCVFDGLC